MEHTLNLHSARVRLIFSAIFLLIFFIAYFDTLVILFRLWAGIEQTIYRYGFLVLACTCYLLYLKRPYFQSVTASPNGWALIPSLALAVAWVVASLAGVQTVQLAVLPFLLLALVTACFGVSILRLAGLPVLLLLFAIPLWWPLLPFLKDATTLATELFLRLINKPVFVEGYYLHLPGGSFFVDDGCAGLRFLLVTLILGFMSVDMYALNWKQGSILVGFGVLMALIANWVRVIVVVLVGDYTRMEHRLVDDHNDLGWVVYGVMVLLPLFVLIGKLTVQEIQSAPLATSDVNSKSASTSFVATIGVAIAILLSGPVLLASLGLQDYSVRSVSVPPATQMWTLAANQESDWRANYTGADAYLFNRYQTDATAVELHVVHYANQQEGVELINVYNTLVDEERWNIVPDSEGQVDVETGSGATVTLLTAVIEASPGQRKLVGYWFEIGSRYTSKSYMAKIYQILALLNGRKDGNLIAMATDCRAQCDREQQQIERFAADMFSSIRSRL